MYFKALAPWFRVMHCGGSRPLEEAKGLSVLLGDPPSAWAGARREEPALRRRLRAGSPERSPRAPSPPRPLAPSPGTSGAASPPSWRPRRADLAAPRAGARPEAAPRKSGGVPEPRARPSAERPRVTVTPGGSVKIYGVPLFAFLGLFYPRCSQDFGGSLKLFFFNRLGYCGRPSKKQKQKNSLGVKY